MEVSFAHVENEQLLVTKFTQSGKEDLDSSADFDIFIGHQEDKDTPHILNLDVSALDYSSALDTFNQSLTNWKNQNNLDLLSNIFSTSYHLKEEMKKSRETAFTSLWQVLRKNLGSYDLTIVFNSLGKRKNKDILTTSVLSGRTKAKFNVASDALIATFQEFKDQNNYDHYHEDANNLTIFSLSASGPILILAKLWQPITLLQRLAAKLILDGLKSVDSFN